MKNLMLAATAYAFAVPAIASEPATREEAQLKAHVAFLASDEMRGRDTGSHEYDIAAQYVAARFLELGLKPAGAKGSYLQPVPLLASKLTDKGTVTLTGAKGDVPLTFGEDFVLSPSVREAVYKADAQLVFAGFGVVAPEFKRNDYAGIDVKGKIVVVLAGAPKNFPAEERAHYGSGGTKALAAEARGALAVISVETPTRAKVRPMSSYVKDWDDERMVWRQPDGKGFVLGGSTPVLGVVSLKGAEKLFAGFPGGAAAVMKAAEGKTGATRSGPLKIGARVTIDSAIRNAESSNVAGLLEGSDPALKAETVVLSAHLDHIGVSEAVNGDTINNGAMDNAMGTGSMIEVARRFVEGGIKPKRSILFLAVTGEEKGLVGADYFARNPTIAREAMVANVNLDMPVLTYDFQDVIAFGAEHSALGPIVREAAAGMGVTLSPDPVPEQGIFTRSDHYRFVQQGVPSVFLVTGYAGPGKAANEEFEEKHYHKPSDQLDLPIDWKAGAKFIALNTAITRALADAPERPRWNKGDFFGLLYNGVGAR